ncbi:cellular retinoic acid-binding protein 2-like protein [Lates japonicus]|uniref:Cellular retinoic acid-binding protein 2-like protein n=1 Tax=Lates japonicus TaxID=270547 RepID=A0AAD3N1R6_LATJO|nr:cellular retinoic acid-binding protein 2-like protein [Lates japonicus]
MDWVAAVGFDDQLLVADVISGLMVRSGQAQKMWQDSAVAAASKPQVEITQDGETLSIRTSTTVRTTHITFTVGQEFNESTVDGRPCTSFPRWETDSKISCEQTLQKGEGPKTSWTREITNDGKLILTMRADDVICTRVYERQQ